MSFRILRGDVREIARELEAESFDGCLCDPPYGLSFMGKKWDYDVPSVETWEAVLGALKPGAHLLAFAGTRTQHRMAVRIEDAGFEIRDMIAWVYGSGFPKSLDVSKAIDKAAGATREVVGQKRVSRVLDAETLRRDNYTVGVNASGGDVDITAPATDAARQWQGWGTALKPALEPITVARKPLRGTVAANCLEYGTGAINIDGCRVGENAGWSYPNGRGGRGWHGRESLSENLNEPMAATQGRWPANLIHDGSEEVLAGFPDQVSGANPTRRNSDKFRQAYGDFEGQRECFAARGAESGSAARFFYCAKASRSEREAGLREAGLREAGLREAECRTGLGGEMPTDDKGADRDRFSKRARNHHPTVKPIALAEYLARLILPPKRADGKPRRLLVPFSGSGSEMIGALRAGWDEVAGIELSNEYAEIAEARLAHWTASQQRGLEFEEEEAAKELGE